MLDRNTTNYLMVIAAELFVGAAMLAGYQTLVEPTAPRHHAVTTAPAQKQQLPVVATAAAAPAAAAEVISAREQGVRALTAERYAEAVQFFQQARQADPGNPDLAYLTGVALEGTNQIGAAIDAFRSCRAGQYAGQAKDHIAMMIAKLQAEITAEAE
jgi:Flp pilus assembly protein TadD